jgi:hypothetical protein
MPLGVDLSDLSRILALVAQKALEVLSSKLLIASRRFAAVAVPCLAVALKLVQSVLLLLEWLPF